MHIATSTADAPAMAGRHLWLRVLGVGLLVYILSLAVLVLTGDTKLFPTVLWLGNFLVPAAYVAFFYGRREHSNVSLPALLETCFWGGILGALLAVPVEAALVHGHLLTLPVGLVVGAIEEWAKLLGVLVVARRWRRMSEMDGVILGAAAGMGFAALESSGYAFGAFVGSGGRLTQETIFLVGESMLRGLFAPLTHGTWTALLVSVMFREQGNRLRGTLKVTGAYLLVIVLHGLWDGTAATIAPLADSQSSLWMLLVPAVMLGVGVCGLVLLRRRWHEAQRREQAVFAAPSGLEAAQQPVG